MTDKEKRELKDGIISIFKRFNILDHTATIGGLRDDILIYIDSMQEEHKLKPKFQKGNKIVYVGERKEPDTEEHTILYVYDDMYATTWGKMIPFKFQDDYQLVEDPVSEELSTAAVEYERRINWNSFYCGLSIIDAFKAGARWLKQQMMKNTVDAVCYVTHYEDETQVAYSVSYPKGEETNKYHDKVKLIIIKED